MLTLIQYQMCLQLEHEPQNWTTGEMELKKVAWSDELHFILHSVDGQVCVSIIWERDVLGCAMERMQECKGEAVWWGKSWVRAFIWMLLWLYYLPKHCCRPNTLLLATAFSAGHGFFQQDNTSWHTTKTVQKWFEEHNEEFKVLSWPPT